MEHIDGILKDKIEANVPSNANSLRLSIFDIFIESDIKWLLQILKLFLVLTKTPLKTLFFQIYKK
ncbi:hypothetical protein HMPREF0650_0441 [Hoylesella buccalis ATCC 35310]|uniref:Uncharacterized protein n=1 Tax=Hoylesella buccalis ATCC 35310 TaxID=679190 RepID=D1W321_9BACT|nr:hypothetical protein HMPREF0650_0441 [Hoylesella buccalis ATCC 35310]